MSSLNRVQLIGHLGQAVELKHLEGGGSVATMSVATNEEWKDKAGQRQERTEWHRVVVWNKLAEHCAKYLDKGRQIFVEGTLRTREWEKDGERRFATEVIARQVIFLGGGNGNGSKRRDEPPPPDASDAGIPF